MGCSPPTDSKLCREPLLFSLHTTFQESGAALRIGRDLRDKLVQTACFTDGNTSNGRGSRAQGHRQFGSRTSTEPPPGFCPAFLQGPSCLLTPSSQCHEEPQTTPKRRFFLYFPPAPPPPHMAFGLKRNKPGSRASGGFLVGEGGKRRVSWSFHPAPTLLSSPYTLLPWS